MTDVTIATNDHRHMRAPLAHDEVNDRWQRQINPLLVADDDYSSSNAGLARIWSLAARSPDPAS